MLSPLSVVPGDGPLYRSSAVHGIARGAKGDHQAISHRLHLTPTILLNLLSYEAPLRTKHLLGHKLALPPVEEATTSVNMMLAVMVFLIRLLRWLRSAGPGWRPSA